jgi:ABC-type multidrug transport system ATPase subunit
MTIVCDSIAKRYGARVVLDGFTARFESFRVAALVGPNGVGKTTLLRIIAGLQQADAGSMTASRTLYFGGSETLPLHGTVASFLTALGLHAAVTDARRLSTLSKGELQRVGLEASFALSADALLLDEPWTALEPDARGDLNDRIMGAARAGRSVVCSSHDLDEVARVADDVVFIRNGRAVIRRRETDELDRDHLLALYHQQQ